jgi:hypothetical protein
MFKIINSLVSIGKMKDLWYFFFKKKATTLHPCRVQSLSSVSVFRDDTTIPRRQGYVFVVCMYSKSKGENKLKKEIPGSSPCKL